MPAEKLVHQSSSKILRLLS